MEGKRGDERQMKKTEDRETSSTHRSGFQKNSDELNTPCGAEDNKTMLQSLENEDEHPLVEALKRTTTPNLTGQRDDELLRYLIGEQEGGSINIDQIATEGIGWWTKRMEKMNSEEFQQFYAALGILRGRVQSHLQQRLRIRDSNSRETSTSTTSTSTNGRARQKRH